VVEAVMLWNEPNNKSHWDFELDREWRTFAEMTTLAGEAVKAQNPKLTRVLGGISPIDPHFMGWMKCLGVLDQVDAVAVHGFPLDWNHWQLNEWPSKLNEIREVTHLPIWVSEVGISTFGAEEVQEWGLKRTAELLRGVAPRVHWYSLFDLPKAWPATTRHKEAEGSAYYRHFYMGLIKEDGTPKLAAKHFYECAPEIGICQWFHFNDPRLESAVQWLRDMGVTYLRTGISWADIFQQDPIRWWDKQMKALEQFSVTVTFCFTPDQCGINKHYTSPPKCTHEFADFCAEMVKRYAC
jgi:beta-xylosidase